MPYSFQRQKRSSALRLSPPDRGRRRQEKTTKQRKNPPRCPPTKVTLITSVVSQQRVASRQTHRGAAHGAARAADNRQAPSRENLRRARDAVSWRSPPYGPRPKTKSGKKRNWARGLAPRAHPSSPCEGNGTVERKKDGAATVIITPNLTGLSKIPPNFKPKRPPGALRAAKTLPMPTVPPTATRRRSYRPPTATRRRPHRPKKSPRRIAEGFF